LRPLTADRPKPMLPVGGVPLVERIVALLARHGITEIAINLHYRPWSIVHHLGLGHRWGVRIHYSFEERLLGSAGAAKRLEWYLDEAFVLYYGDVYTEMDLGRLMEAHREGGGLITLGLYEVENPTACGIVALDGAGRVQRFVEKPAADEVFSRLANAGVLVVEPEVLRELAEGQVLDVGRDVIPGMLAAGRQVVGYRIQEPLIDIGTPENYRKAQQMAAQWAATQAGADLCARLAAPTVRNVFQRFSAAYAD
jgi:NDP-sugar pyrophosphorylase family protein